LPRTRIPRLHSLSTLSHRVDEAQLKYITFALLSALKAIHSAKCVHNDVKPDNVLISQLGDVKLSDFGCCTKLKSEDSVLSGTPRGSKAYFAPEKALLSPPRFGAKADIWALGLTMYELATLTMRSAREFCAVPDMKMVKGYSVEAVEFMGRMLCWEAKERGSAEELLGAEWIGEGVEMGRRPFGGSGEVVKKEAELAFMIECLVEVYSARNFYDGEGDDKERDLERIANLAKYSGCTGKEVVTMIKFAVGNVKRQIEKLSRPVSGRKYKDIAPPMESVTSV